MLSRTLSFVAAVVLAAGCSQKPAEVSESAAIEPADTIYLGGDVVTVDDNNPVAKAVAVRGGLIVAVGSEADVLSYQDADTNVVDLDGHVLAPGFIDGHAHFLGFGAQAIGANMLAPPDGEVRNIDDLVEALRAFAKGPDVERIGWIFGMGYDDAILEEGRHPTAEDLDRVSTELPVMAIHISGHFAAVNTVGLQTIGYDASTPDPEGGIIRRKPGTQEPNGVLEELAAIPYMLNVLNPTSEEDQLYFVDRAQQLATSMGYTTAQEGRAFASSHGTLVLAAEAGELDIDVVSYIDYANREVIESDWHSPNYRKRYRIGGMKITLDGSPQGRTAWRTIPYLVPPDGQEDGYLGYPAIPDDEVVAGLFAEAFENDWQVLTHANGDAAIDQLIRSIRPSAEKFGAGDRRHVLIHGQFTRQDQLDDLKQLNVIPSLFPMHTFYWGDWYDVIIGPELAQQISPIRSAIDRGMIVTSHTDAPVALPNLIRVMDATVNRTSRSGKVMGPDERLTPLEALKAVTLWSAYQHFEEDRKGSIEVGKLADLVILSDNPLTVPTETIGTIEVLETIKEGRTVFKR